MPAFKRMLMGIDIFWSPKDMIMFISSVISMSMCIFFTAVRALKASVSISSGCWPAESTLIAALFCRGTQSIIPSNNANTKV